MDKRQITNPHANFFQKVFSRMDIAHDLVLHYLPEKLVKQLDLSTLELDRESFVDILLSATQSDLVFKVKTKDKKKLLIYILIEHKSFLDRWVLFQLLGYIVRLNEREREINALERKNKRQENIKNDLPENKGIEKECITVILPVILYHGTKDWTIDEKGGNVIEAVSNIWIEQGKKEKSREMVIEALKIKYNNVTKSISSIVQSIKDEEMLHSLHREVILCNNMSEFQHRLEKIRCVS